MNSAATVRLFRDEDAEPLTDLLHRAYAELGREGLNFTAVDQSSEITLARARGGRCWVLEGVNGSLLGTVTMSSPPSTSLRALTAQARVEGRVWLNQLAVDPARRGEGLARLLWGTAREWAEEQGFASVGIDTAAPAEHLIALYERWGFARVDTIRWEGKTYESVVLVRDLARSSRG